MKTKRNFYIISLALFLIFIIFTILVKTIDVQTNLITNTKIGFATLNNFVFKKLGTNETLYDLTEILGLIPIAIVLVYVVIAVIQWVKRKNLFKIDKELLILGLFYVIVFIFYVLFEIVVINYRPILIEGEIEASYPSSHTLLAICLCGSAIIVNLKLFSNLYTKIGNVLLLVVMTIIVVGRLLSGVHWLTDIVGGIILSLSFLSCYYATIK